MTPEELRIALESHGVPEHRPGFWDELTEELQAEAAGPAKRSGWLVAFSAAAAVIVVAGVAALLIRQASVDPIEPGPIASSPVSTATTGTTNVEPPTAPEAVNTVPTAGDTAPWDRDVLAVTDVPLVLVEEWQRAENQLWCSALYPIETGVDDAVLRRAEFSGGWALAWDLPELRSAFGVAGVGSPAWGDIGTRMPAAVMYGGQVVGYGGEGFDDDAQERLAEFTVPGQLCAYQVWSKLGDEHLLGLVDSLRRVEGLEADPVDGDAMSFGPPDRGPAPWAAQAVPYPQDWPAAPTETLAFIPTTGLPDDASVRTTTQPMWSLAWDTEKGPGHDTLNYPCLACGRGVVGVTVSSVGAFPDAEPDVQWDDGSVGYILPRVGDPGIPVDRVLLRAPGSDDLVPGAPQIDIYIPDLGVVVSIWSHLGTESLFELVDGLRLADPGL